MMVSVEIDAEEMIDSLVNRIAVLTNDEDVIALYEKMYENYVYGGCFEGSEFNVMAIADNDYVNLCDVIRDGEEHYDEIKAFYDENGCGDCSCEIYGISYIEAEHNGMFLVRY